MNPPERIEKNVVVSVAYRLSLDSGELVEETDAGEPLMYLHGHDNIIPGLERELEGMTVGSSKVVVVEAADAYGEHDPEDIDEIDRDDLPVELEPEVGMLLEIEDESGQEFLAQIVDVTDETIRLDFNHPMAGKRLHFEITITGLRAATPEELDHGHVHNPDDHHHH